MDKFMADMAEVFANPKYLEMFLSGIWETLYSTVLATAAACILGLILGVLLVAGEKTGVRPLPSPVMKLLNFITNILRSVPFLILMLFVLPLSGLLLGTKIGTPASIPPLVVAAFPFVARLVETSLRDVDHGVIEAAQAMGCTPFQIIRKVLLPECLPSLISGFTTSFITILSYGAMAGAIGYNYAVMLIATILIVILVTIFQALGSYLANRMDHRITKTTPKSKKHHPEKAGFQ